MNWVIFFFLVSLRADDRTHCASYKAAELQPAQTSDAAFNDAAEHGIILICISLAGQAASLRLDPQCIRFPASHVHTCPSWPAAMATNVNFFRQHAGRLSASILPFILCESITATKQDRAVV